MGRYLVVAPANGDDEHLFEELERLAAREASSFHVLVPRQPGGDTAADDAARHHLAAVLDALAAGGLQADGEVGEASVLGSVARATDRTHYDAVVVPVEAIGVLERLDLDVARRLHQLDVPNLQLVTPGRRPGWIKAPNASGRAAQHGDGPSRPPGRTGVVVGGVLIAILAVLVAILVSYETHHAELTAPQAVTLQVSSAGGR